MLKREILLTGCAIVLALSAQEAKAAEACTATPTCAALGYTETSCNGLSNLKCPFDSTKMFCGTNRQVIYSGSTAIGVAVNSHLAVAMTDEGAMPWNNAVATCKAKTTGGRSWRLPTKDEILAMTAVLDTLNLTLAARGGAKMIEDFYWSSTEYSSTSAWYVGVYNGYSNYKYKTYTSIVRCVFAF